MTDQDSAPGELALIERFINTAALDTGRDDIAGPRGLAQWAREEGFGRASFGDSDAARVVAFREALRALLLSHHGEPPDQDALALLGSEGARAPLAIAFADDGATRLEPAGGGVDAVLGRLLAVIARADAEGTWARLKACPADDCRWAFFDHSRNRSRTWCSMAGCGNRAKARSYRARLS